MKIERDCHSCVGRHGCPYPFVPYDAGVKCKHWKLGKCFTCAYLNDTDENWYKRGCEAECFGGCKKYKRDWKATLDILRQIIQGNGIEVEC